jgi:adenylyl-sulfate kinase
LLDPDQSIRDGPAVVYDAAAVTDDPRNIRWHAPSVGPEERGAIKSQRGAALWFTGLSGAGKSTIAALVDRKLHDAGQHSYVLDGDNLRFGLCSDLGFSPEDRAENIRRIGEVARLFVDAGLLVLVAAISPYRRDRELARSRVAPDRFLEIFVDTSLSVCEARDPKGLYRRARAGEITGLSGVDAPYEAPTSPELRLAGDDPAALADRVIAELAARRLIVPGGVTERVGR